MEFTTWYVQHSKKLTVAALIQWSVIIFVILCILLINMLLEKNAISQYQAQIFKSVISWSSTMTGVTIATYMGNSAVQKYAQSKFNHMFKVEEGDEQNG